MYTSIGIQRHLCFINFLSGLINLILAYNSPRLFKAYICENNLIQYRFKIIIPGVPNETKIIGFENNLYHVNYIQAGTTKHIHGIIFMEAAIPCKISIYFIAFWLRFMCFRYNQKPLCKQ